MSENAIRIDGEQIKSGTCEDMDYLRYDQLDQIAQADDYSIDPRDPRVQQHIRFRFPFPDEDHIRAGEFRDYDRGYRVDAPVPDGVQHHRVHFQSTNGQHLLVMLPCPQSAEAAPLEAAGIHVGRHWRRGGVEITQQKRVGDKLVTVTRCADCKATWRNEDLADMAGILDQLDAAAAEHDRAAHAVENTPREHLALGYQEEADRIRAIARRIRDGYTTPGLAA